MACFNIIDHRNHPLDPKCDAVLETLAPTTHPAHEQWIPDLQFLVKTTVSKVMCAAHARDDSVCVCLYDSGSISRKEIKSVLKNK
jgi:hypothetical protein